MDSRRAMNRPPLPSFVSIVSVALLVAAIPVAAAPPPPPPPVYKIVAPDGHITYSDQKPSGDAQNQASVIGAAGTHRPLVAPAPVVAGLPKLYLPPQRPSEGPALRAIVSIGRGNASRDPQLVEGLVVASGYEALVQGYLDTCAGTMPSSLGRFNAAARAWHQMNDGVLGQANKLRANLFSSQQQAAIQAVAQDRAAVILTPAKEASVEPRIRWCDESTDALKGPLLNLATKAGIANGLEPYVVR